MKTITKIYISGCKSVGEQVIEMREAMRQLPPAHYNCLKFMIEHLNRLVIKPVLTVLKNISI